jgi:PAS domain S-box-containing protein
LTSYVSLPQDASLDAIQSGVKAGSEQRLSIDRVARLMPGFVYVFNHQTFSNDYTNRSVGEHLGYSSEEIRAFGSSMMMQVIHADDQHLLEGHMARIGQLADEQTATLEYRVNTKQGTQLWLRSVDTVFDRTDDGSVLRHIGVASDITAEKNAGMALTRLNAELEQKVAKRTKDLARLNVALEDRIDARTAELQEAVDELEQLTYIATHDLKVPINNLSRLGLMLINGGENLTHEQLEQIGWMNRCTDQLSAKIQGLVLAAQIRLTNGLPREMLKLVECVNDCVTRVGESKGRLKLPVTVDIAPDLVVHFARFELESILFSLLDNAVKYAEPSRPLEIRIQAEEIDGNIALTVSDNGTGVDPVRDAQKVFGLFQRAHKTPAGSGISLYCAQRMLQRRGGAVSLTGARAQGAQFTILIPTKEETNEAA